MSKIEEKIESLFSHYLHKPSGETVAALKFPAGYEDRNPNEFEGVAGTEKAETVVGDVEPVPPVDLNTPVAPVPSAGDTGEEATPAE